MCHSQVTMSMFSLISIKTINLNINTKNFIAHFRSFPIATCRNVQAQVKRRKAYKGNVQTVGNEQYLLLTVP